MVIGSKLLDQGRRSKIFSTNKGTVIKLYEKGFPLEDIQREFKNTQAIYKSEKLLVPKPLSILKQAGLNGIEMEEIKGVSLMNLFQKNPLLYFTYTGKIAAIHRKIHKIKITGIQTHEDFFFPILYNSNRLTKEEKDILVEILKRKTQNILCHGDFHHGNLIQNKDGKIYIIDWMDAFVGNPLLDVALSAVNGVVSTAPPHVPQIYRSLYEVIKRAVKLDKRYLYVYNTPDTKEMREMLALAAGIHLARVRKKDYSLHRTYLTQSLSSI